MAKIKVGHIGKEDGTPTRLGVDVPTNLKRECAIKAMREGLTMTQVVIALLDAWYLNKIELEFTPKK